LRDPCTPDRAALTLTAGAPAFIRYKLAADRLQSDITPITRSPGTGSGASP